MENRNASNAIVNSMAINNSDSVGSAKLRLIRNIFASAELSIPKTFIGLFSEFVDSGNVESMIF